MSDNSGRHARHNAPVYPKLSRHLLVIAIIMVGLTVLCVPPVRHAAAIPFVWLIDVVTDFFGLLAGIVIAFYSGVRDLF